MYTCPAQSNNTWKVCSSELGLKSPLNILGGSQRFRPDDLNTVPFIIHGHNLDDEGFAHALHTHDVVPGLHQPHLCTHQHHLLQQRLSCNIHSSIHSLVQSLSCLLAHSTSLLGASLTRSLDQPAWCLTHSLTRSLTHSLTLLLAHSLD